MIRDASAFLPITCAIFLRNFSLSDGRISSAPTLPLLSAICSTSILTPCFMYPFWRTFSCLTIFTVLCPFNLVLLLAQFSQTHGFVDAEIINQTIHANSFFPDRIVEDFVSHTRSRLRENSFLPSLLDEMSSFTLFTSCFNLRKSEALLRQASEPGVNLYIAHENPLSATQCKLCRLLSSHPA